MGDDFKEWARALAAGLVFVAVVFAAGYEGPIPWWLSAAGGAALLGCLAALLAWLSRWDARAEGGR